MNCDLSIIIVNYNVRQFLENALSSITKAMSGIEGEIFVVDNASDDGSVEMVHNTFPGVKVIQNRENVGFAKANNMALCRATGRFLLLINPDTVVQEDTFRVMLRFFEEHPDAGLAGCKVLNPDGTFQLPCRRSFPTPWVAFTKVFGLSTLIPGSRLFGRYNLTYLSPDETYPVDAVSGSFMMLRREVYERIGGLDESFFMYGEDLDWCYRVVQAGYKVYYVHKTAIIHFKGESTRRSDLNEVRVFYQAMQLFVSKHFGRIGTVRLLLSLGIIIREAMSRASRLLRSMVLPVVDAFLVNVAILFSAFLYFRLFWKFPAEANAVVWIAPALLVLFSMAGVGAYTVYRHSITRSIVGVVSGYVLISAAVFFVRHLAYSRAVVILSGFLSILLIPGYRLFLRRRTAGGRGSLFGNRTLIVGTGASGREVLRKLRARVDDGYDVVGFIDSTNMHVGEKLDGVEIVGSMENVGKVVDEKRVSEVIFSTDGLSYAEILSVIARSKARTVNYRLVPGSLEAIIGKTRIDQLDTFPLVDIEYNIQMPGHRFVKRLLDITLALLLLVLLYVPVRLLGRNRKSRFVRTVLRMPGVLTGQLSVVGLPVDDGGTYARELSQRYGGADLGPLGLTGLIQVNRRPGLTSEEMERYALYYAKNQSFGLDVEIILKAINSHSQQRAGTDA